MIELKITCSMCGKEFPFSTYADTLTVFTVEALKKRLQNRQWIVQINKPNIDTYCSKECAK